MTNTSSNERKSPIVFLEHEWRSPPAFRNKAETIISRWTCLEPYPSRDACAEAAAVFHTIAIFLRTTECTFSLNGQQRFRGLVTSGTFQVTRAGDSARMSFRCSSDVLHIYVPPTLVRDVYERSVGNAAPASTMLPNTEFRRDEDIEILAQSILRAEQYGGDFSRICAESACRAIVARILALANRSAESTAIQGLAPWRLTRVVEFIDTHLTEPISLSEISAVSGLTKMHFAAQFRLSTGLRPHEFLVRRRIERAQDLLASTDATVVRIAIDVGFQSPAHFATVFKRFVGDSPTRWRSLTNTDGNRSPASTETESAQLARAPKCHPVSKTLQLAATRTGHRPALRLKRDC
jgi:AraC family transcriptional regulator